MKIKNECKNSLSNGLLTNVKKLDLCANEIRKIDAELKYEFLNKF